jgi:hypothetical protein
MLRIHSPSRIIRGQRCGAGSTPNLVCRRGGSWSRCVDWETSPGTKKASKSQDHRSDQQSAVKSTTGPRPTWAMQQVGSLSGVQQRRHATWSQRQRITRSGAEADTGCTKPQMPADYGSALHYPRTVNAVGGSLRGQMSSSRFAKTAMLPSAAHRRGPSLLEGIQCIETLCSR